MVPLNSPDESPQREEHDIAGLTSAGSIFPGQETKAVRVAASAALVNRTHRVVRERAKTIKERRSKIRSLWVPLILFSSLVLSVSVAVWSVLGEYEMTAAESQVGGYQFVVPLLWLVPVSAAVLAVVWFRQPRADASR